MRSLDTIFISPLVVVGLVDRKLVAMPWGPSPIAVLCDGENYLLMAGALFLSQPHEHSTADVWVELSAVAAGTEQVRRFPSLAQTMDWLEERGLISR